MKLNISYPATGCQKLVEIEDEKKLRGFYEKRMGQEVEGDSLGDEWKGYVFRIAGGNDKQGFPMKQGVLTAGRVRLLLSKGHSCYRPRRSGERKRKSVRGCIVDSNLSVLALIVKKKGEQEVEGLTDKTVPRRLGPKRASKIRKLFNLTKTDDVRQYVIRHPKPAKKEGKKERSVAPKIQRLITPLMLQHKRRRVAIKRKRAEKRQEDEQSYSRLLAQRAKEEKERRAELARKRRSTRESQSSAGGDDTPATKKSKKAAAPGPDDKPKFKGDKYKGKTAQEYFRMVAARKATAAARKAAAEAKAAKGGDGKKPAGKAAAPAKGASAKPAAGKASGDSKKTSGAPAKKAAPKKK